MKWWQIFWELDDSRAPITRRGFGTFLLLTIVSAAIYAMTQSWSSPPSMPIGANIVNVLALICVSVFTSATAAAMVDILARMRDLARFKWEQESFRGLFNVGLDARSVAIVLPKLPGATPASGHESLEQEPQVPRPDFDDWVRFAGVNKGLVFVDESLAAYSDVVAASSIIGAFAAQKLPIPDILWSTTDAGTLIIQAPEAGGYTSFISIGVFTNHLTAWINGQASLPGRCFAIQHDRAGLKTTRHRHERFVLGNGDVGEDARAGYGIELMQGGKIEHGLLAKVLTDDGRTVVICGAINAKGTGKLGRYVGRHWQDIVNLQDNANGVKVGSRPFTVVFRIVERDDGDRGDKDVSVAGVKVWLGESAAHS